LGDQPAPKPQAPSNDSNRKTLESVANPLDQIETLKSRSVRVAEDLVQRLPQSAGAVAVLALAHSRFGGSDEAMRCWEACRELDPRFGDAYHGMATILLKKGEYAQAVELSREALQLDPAMPGVHVLLAEALMNIGRIEEAVDVLDECVKIWPNSVEAFFWRGQAHLQLKQYKQAKESHERAIQLDPTCTYAYYGFATACARLGERERSKEYLGKFRELKAADQKAERDRLHAFDDLLAVSRGAAFVHTAAGEVYRRHGRHDEAQERLLEAASLDPDDTLCREKLASLYQQSGRSALALEVLQQLSKIQPDNPAHLVKRGLICFHLQRFQQAESTLRRAIDIAPQWSGGYVALAQVYLQTRRNPTEAERLAKKAVALEPTAQHYYLLSLAYDTSGNRDEAIDAIGEALKLDPGNAEYQRIRKALQERQ